MDDGELLRRYAAGDEASFAELVNRHIDLVYSAGLRQVDGDSAAAADLTQSVFLDLANKASKLQAHTSINGWLYTSVRYLAANVRRAESRRRARELYAHAMTDFSQSPEPNWTDLRPVIDDAMHDLADEERHAILLRIFESKPLAEVGRALGVTENAARMRVERALEKLRAALQKRGITATALSISGLLSANAIAAAPAGLPSRVLNTAGRPAPTAGILGLFLAHKLKVAMGIAALALALPFVLPAKDGSAGRGSEAAIDETEARVATRDAGATTGTAQSTPPPTFDAPVGTAPNREGPHLALTIVDAATGAPIPNVPLDQLTWDGGGLKSAMIYANRLGLARVPLPDGITRLQITTRVEDFADTRLKWSPMQGDVIPPEYTLQLTRPVNISGRVVDANGNPVEGATVGFVHGVEARTEATVQSHNFGGITAVTDAHGYWHMNRIAPDMLSHSWGDASHPDHAHSPVVLLEYNPRAEKQLREGEYVFHLRRGFNVAGKVTDASGNPIPNAKLLVGRYGMSESRNGTSDARGHFMIMGCASGRTSLAAEAVGFAPTTLNIEIGPDEPNLHQIVLGHGGVLNIRVVDREGKGIRDINALLNTINVDPPIKGSKPRVQSDPKLKSNAQGRIQWINAPDEETIFDFEGPAYMRKSNVRLRPSTEEHTVVMDPALRISGDVVDAETGRPLPEFRIVAGWPPAAAPGSRPHWSPIDRFTRRFVGSNFDTSYEEPVVHRTAHRGYVFKFEADGYAPDITDTIAPDAGHVTFNIRLKRWASVEGVLLQSGEPLPGRDLQVTAIGAAGQTRSDPFDARTDAGGRFKFPTITPGVNQLLLKISVDVADGRKGFSVLSIHEFEAKSGETGELKVELREHEAGAIHPAMRLDRNGKLPQ